MNNWIIPPSSNLFWTLCLSVVLFILYVGKHFYKKISRWIYFSRQSKSLGVSNASIDPKELELEQYVIKERPTLSTSDFYILDKTEINTLFTVESQFELFGVNKKIYDFKDRSIEIFQIIQDSFTPSRSFSIKDAGKKLICRIQLDSFEYKIFDPKGSNVGKVIVRKSSNNFYVWIDKEGDFYLGDKLVGGFIRTDLFKTIINCHESFDRRIGIALAILLF